MRTVYLLAITSVILVTSQIVARDAFAQTQIPWAASFVEAQDIARTEHKLILLHFSMEGCKPCHFMETAVFPRTDVVEAVTAAFVPVYAHSSKTPELVRRYRVRSFPTDVIVTASGQEVYRSEGSMPPPKYIAMLREQAFNAGGLLAKSSTSPSRGDKKPLPPLLTGEAPAEDEVAADASAAPAQEETVNHSIAAREESAPPAAASRNASKVFSNPHYSPLDEAQAELESQERNAPSTESEMPPQQAVNNRTTVPAQEESIYGSSEEPSEAHGQATDVADTSVPQNEVAPSEPPVAPKTPVAQTESVAPTTPKVAKTPKFQLPPNSPPLAMEGRCPVTLHATKKWKTGDPRYGAIHRGRTYLFTDAGKQQEFLRDPDTYAPAFCGYDPVYFAEKGELTNGSIQFGAMFKGKTFLFADAESRDRFLENSQQYDEVVYQAMLTEDMNKSKLR